MFVINLGATYSCNRQNIEEVGIAIVSTIIIPGERIPMNLVILTFLPAPPGFYPTTMKCE